MPMVRAMRMLNAIELGTLNSTQLESLLSDPSRLLEWTTLCGMRGQMRRMAATPDPLNIICGSTTAINVMAGESNAIKAIISRPATLSVMVNHAAFMTAVAASATAMTAVAASATAMSVINANDQAVRIWMLAGTNQIYSNFANVSAVAASTTAMSAVIASTTAMSAVAASATARLAIWNSDTALAAIQASGTAVTTMMAASTAVSTNTGSATYTFVPSGTKVILLRRWYSGNEYDYLNYARDGSSNLPGYAAPAISYGPGYNNLGSVPTANNSNANNVRACNGLRRETWNNGVTLCVIYLPV